MGTEFIKAAGEAGGPAGQQYLTLNVVASSASRVCWIRTIKQEGVLYAEGCRGAGVQNIAGGPNTKITFQQWNMTKRDVPSPQGDIAVISVTPHARSLPHAGVIT